MALNLIPVSLIIRPNLPGAEVGWRPDDGFGPNTFDGRLISQISEL